MSVKKKSAGHGTSEKTGVSVPVDPDGCAAEDERSACEKTGVSVLVDPDVGYAAEDAWAVPETLEMRRQRRRERRAARQAREADDEESRIPTREVQVSAIVPILWLLIPLILVVLWTLIES